MISFEETTWKLRGCPLRDALNKVHPSLRPRRYSAAACGTGFGGTGRPRKEARCPLQDRSGWRLCSRSSCWSRRSPRPRNSAAHFRAPSPTHSRPSSRRDRARHEHHDRRHPRGGDVRGRRLPRAQPRRRRLHRRNREDGIPEGAPREPAPRDQRDPAPRLHARGIGGRRERDGRIEGAARRDGAGPRVRPRRSHAAAGDAAQRQEPLQPARAPAGRHRARVLRVDQRRRRRRRLVCR